MRARLSAPASTRFTSVLRTGTEVKVFSNMTVYPADVLGYDLTEAGIDEKVRTDVLLEIMEEAEGEREK